MKTSSTEGSAECLCAICEEREPQLGRDLCWTCEDGLRWFGHDPERLEAAADYIESHR